MNESLVTIRELSVHFHSPGHGVIRAVDRVSLEIGRGETVGLVGESGCGKTTLGRTVVHLTRPTAGEVNYGDGINVDDMRQFRRKVQMIFQDPYSALDPLMTVQSIVAEPIHALALMAGEHVRARVEELMKLVGLNLGLTKRYPHELSAGQRQRVGIARALAARPEFIVADEPISALDVSIQAQILNLLQKLQDDLGLSYLFISHDLRAVHHMSDRVAVMYMGRIVEMAAAEELFARPLMPYTRALISALPFLHHTQDATVLRGDVSSMVNPPSGCRFHPRCPYAIEECTRTEPVLRQITAGHWAACIRIGQDEPDIEQAAERGIRSQQSSA